MVGEGLQALDCAAEVLVVQWDVVLALLSKKWATGSRS